MTGGDGMNGDPLTALLKLVLGDVPARGAIKLIAVGAILTAFFYFARDFRNDIRAESAAVRFELRTYIESNQVWQESSKEERARLLRKANARLRRLYTQQGWDYEDVE